MVIKSGRGGARNGAGRKPAPPEVKKISYATKLRPEQVAWLRNQHLPAAQILEMLIDDAMEGLATSKE